MFSNWEWEKKKNLLQHIEESSINRQSDYKWNTEKAIWQGGGTNLMTTYGKISDTNNHTVLTPPTPPHLSVCFMQALNTEI